MPVAHEDQRAVAQNHLKNRNNCSIIWIPHLPKPARRLEVQFLMQDFYEICVNHNLPLWSGNDVPRNYHIVHDDVSRIYGKNSPQRVTTRVLP